MGAGWVALLAAGLVGCGGVTGSGDEIGDVTGELVVPSAVANMVPSGVVQSTGNLYWTRNEGSTGFPIRWTGRVYRAGKDNVPGHETVLYSESGGLGASFGNITFANDGGVWYGYFLASYFRSGTYIKRVPLDGSSPAITFGQAPSSASAGSQLLSDGMYLYYYGPNGLYAAPINGGPTVTVVAIPGITSIGFDRAHIYFSVGNDLHWAWKPNFGNATFDFKTFPEPIVSIFVSPGADNDDSKTTVDIATTHSVTHMVHGLFTSIGTNPNYTISSIAAEGEHLMWTWCNSQSTCYLVDHNFAGSSTGTLVQSGAHSVMGDGSSIFFIDNYALERLAH
jgi:hypothetical protein